MKIQPRSVLKVFALAVFVLFVVQVGDAVAGLSYNKLSTMQKRLLSGSADLLLNPDSLKNTVTKAGTLALSGFFPGFIGPSYFPGSDGCQKKIGTNIKTTEDCLNLTDPDFQGAAQAKNETAIAVNPNDPNQIVAAFNDYRLGDGFVSVSFSRNGGLSWEDGIPPAQFTRGAAFGAAAQFWQAGSDPSVAWDSVGNAYVAEILFQRGSPPTPDPDLSSAIYVFRSTQNGGASWNFPGRPVIEINDVNGTTPGLFEDKPYMTVDNKKGSPFQDRVYVSWAEFSEDHTVYIWEAYSDDYGEHFSSKVLVSGDSPLCPNTYGLLTPQGRCNENELTQPFTGPDGALYIVFANYNNAVTGNDNRNQMLLAKSIDGGKTFSSPVKVADFYDLPDCATYQGGLDPGRACIPEKWTTTNSYFRATNYPSGAVNPLNPKQLAVTFGSYINQGSHEPACVPNGFSPGTGLNLFVGVKTLPGCTNGILVSVSNDGGASFTGGVIDPRNLPYIPSQSGKKADKFWQWEAWDPSGKMLLVSYYDRQYEDAEITGFSDISLSRTKDLINFKTVRVTSSPNPPPTQFGGTFMGDYSGLAVDDKRAHPLWTDTRLKDLFLCPGTGIPGAPPDVCKASAPNASFSNSQNIFVDSVPVFIPGG